ncbi:alanine--tRNA ligase [Halocatena pleomorpha]|uniref:Alanine--tRNA ligase n=1 Tax=Halocatena pleomorpha TaxID=1785090 RepID=A0A3P3R347_9EURY|nr:alanine--tRNA ligase [Halocatena pleomorpha]RRJ27892.1 alanine--tRNA ligase [Halocatena pleomorpha]
MSELDEEYQLDYFEQEGFTRKECVSCGAHFWTRDEARKTCGEPPCEQYSFIGNPGFDASYTLEEMREEFLSFFEDNDHERIDPYPVAANRWRDDVLLTQASIYDFQPLITSGQAPPPANPLCISQPSIRMDDIQNVGKTGRHTMAFEMMAHHAFNTREDAEGYAYQGETYWKDRTVQYCDEFFESMGVDLTELIYIEYPWVGGGNAGPALEVIYRGVELATLVFLSMEEDPEGEYEMPDGNRYSKMDTYIVDTGYGLERWTWVSQGTPTVYEAVYPEMISFLRENAGIDLTDEEDALVHRAATLAGNLDIDEAEDMESARADIAEELGVDVDRLRELMEPLETIYAIADHSRTLAYMLGDGIVPSNVESGYLVRMVLRRTKRLTNTVGVSAPLDELVDMQAERLGYTNRDTIRDIVRTELEKYRETLDRGGRRVRQLAEEYANTDEPISTTELIELYDSHGMQPDMVAEIAEEHGASVEIPDDFFSLVAARHTEPSSAVADEKQTDTTATQEETDHDDLKAHVSELPPTEQLYYDDQDRMEFEAIVLDVIEREEGFAVVLDQTMFYPEGGGQPADTGALSTDDTSANVHDVQQRDGVILHWTDDDPGKGEFVRGQIDATRRKRLMAHHTATHIIGHSAREVLGDHVRQAGAQKGIDSSRLDVTHYERISRAQRQEIERIANRIVRDNTPVVQEWPDRHVAEEQYGFDIYQGGIPPGTNIRLIHVDDDVQACAGTHVGRTGDIGCIKIRSTERVQDGVERIVFSAGDAAIDATQRVETALSETAETLDVSPLEVPDTAERFFEEWKDRGKRIDALKEELAEIRAHGGATEEVAINGNGTTAVVERFDADVEELRATATAIAEEESVAVLGSGQESAQFVVAVPEKVDVNAGEVVRELADRVGGGGGGPPDFAQGGGPDVDALDAALADAPTILQQKLETR